MMDRRTFLGTMSLLLAAPLAAEAQPAAKIAKIGILRAGSPPDVYVEVFELGGYGLALKHQLAHPLEQHHRPVGRVDVFGLVRCDRLPVGLRSSLPRSLGVRPGASLRAGFQDLAAPAHSIT
jgi:hypothetical protein